MNREPVAVENNPNLFDAHLLPYTSVDSADYHAKQLKTDNHVNVRPSLVSLQISSTNENNIVIQLEEKEYQNEAELEEHVEMRKLERQRGGANKGSSNESHICRNCQCINHGKMFDISRNRNLYRNTFGPTVDETLLVGYETLCCLCNREVEQDEDLRDRNKPSQSLFVYVEHHDEPEMSNKKAVETPAQNLSDIYDSDIEIRNKETENLSDEVDIGRGMSSNTSILKDNLTEDTPQLQEEIPEPQISPRQSSRPSLSPRCQSFPRSDRQKSYCFCQTPTAKFYDSTSEGMSNYNRCSLTSRQPIPNWQQRKRFPTVEFKRSDQIHSSRAEPPDTPHVSNLSEDVRECNCGCSKSTYSTTDPTSSSIRSPPQSRRIQPSHGKVEQSFMYPSSPNYLPCTIAKKNKNDDYFLSPCQKNRCPQNYCYMNYSTSRYNDRRKQKDDFRQVSSDNLEENAESRHDSSETLGTGTGSGIQSNDSTVSSVNKTNFCSLQIQHSRSTPDNDTLDRTDFNMQDILTPIAESTTKIELSPISPTDESKLERRRNSKAACECPGLPTIIEEPEEGDEKQERGTRSSAPTTSTVSLPRVPTPPASHLQDETSESTYSSDSSTDGSSSIGGDAEIQYGIKSISNSGGSSVVVNTTEPEIGSRSEHDSYSKNASTRKPTSSKERGQWENEREEWKRKLRDCEEKCEIQAKRLEEEYNKLSEELAKEQEERQREREEIKREFERKLRRERELREGRITIDAGDENCFVKLESEHDLRYRNSEDVYENKVKREMELGRERKKLLDEEKILEEERKKRIRMEREMESEKFGTRKGERQPDKEDNRMYTQTLQEKPCKLENNESDCKCSQKKVPDKSPRRTCTDENKNQQRKTQKKRKPERELRRQVPDLRRNDNEEDRYKNSDLRKRNREPQETKYAVTRITRYGDFKTYEILKTTSSKPKSVPCTPEEIFIVKNKGEFSQ